MLATYGLRPHEIFYLDTRDLENGGDTISVLPGTKTGARRAFPLHRKWIDYFNLRHKKTLIPKGKNKSEIGSEVSRQFKKAGIPCLPYDLRHAWAVRACQVKMDVTLAARWMGHGVDVHTRTYQKWMSPEIEQQLYEEMIQPQAMKAADAFSNQPSLAHQSDEPVKHLPAELLPQGAENESQEMPPQSIAPGELSDSNPASTIEVQAEPEATTLQPSGPQTLPGVHAAVSKKKNRRSLPTTDGEFEQLALWVG